MHRTFPRVALLVLLIICNVAAADEIERTKKFWINRSEKPTITIDGILREKEWAGATLMQLSYEVSPAENIPPKVQTECYLTYDETHLYAGCVAHDPNPNAIRAYYSDRDNASNDDQVGLVIDPFNDERRAFKFFVNALGVQMDQFRDEVRKNEDSTWDTIWDSKGQITRDGFMVEMAIPFRSIRFESSSHEQTWGFDFVRIYPRDKKYVIALSPRNRNIDCYLCQIAKAVGFSGISPGRNVEFDPTFTASRREQRVDLVNDDFNEETEADAGLSMIWGITPNWTFNAAFNPDFSNVEADVAQLNVNRQFALFFPEKRPFFLEGADIYETQLNAIFTRNIADPLFGAKFTGKSGRNAVGFLASYDEITNFLIPGSQRSRSFSLNDRTTDAIFRYRLDVGRKSSLGVLATDREGTGYYNRLAGVDGVFQVSSSNSIRFQALGSQTDYPDIVSAQFSQSIEAITGYALNIAFNHSSRNWSFFARHQNIDPEFRADLGFIPRVNMKLYAGGLGYTVVPKPNSWYSFISILGNGNYITDQEGNFLGRIWNGSFQFGGPLQSTFALDSGVKQDLFSGIIFDQFYVDTTFSISPSKNTFFYIFGNFGDEIDFVNIRKGNVIRLLPLIQLRAGRHFTIDFSHSYEDFRIDEENLYTANLPQVKIVYQFDSRTFVRLITQYSIVDRNVALYTIPVEPKTKTLFNQFLFSYKVNPRTVLFLGYSDNHLEITDVALTRTNRTVYFKVGYAWQI
jgi:Domain of unknown function (DUF5916)/Carbohydrate family 9 binding domain-like